MKTHHAIGFGALAAIGLAACLAAGPASAQTVVFDNFGPRNTYQPNLGWAITGPTNGNPQFTHGDQFTPGVTGTLTNIDIALELVMGPNHVDLLLTDDASGLPGTVLERFSVDDPMAPFGTGNAPITVNSVLHPVLAEGTPYWLVASAADDTWVSWNQDSIQEEGTHAVSRQGGPFTVGTKTQGAFRVTLTPAGGPAAVPEPSALALLLGCGLGSALLVVRRRR